MESSLYSMRELLLSPVGGENQVWGMQNTAQGMGCVFFPPLRFSGMDGGSTLKDYWLGLERAKAKPIFNGLPV